MKKSNIAERVFNVNLKYTRLQNKTKEIFFECLQDGEDVDYFKAKLEELWGNIDNSYLEEQIIEYRAFLHEINTGKKLNKDEVSIFELASLGTILATNKLFQKIKTKEYETRITSFAYEKNKDEYLKKLVPKYTSDIKRYKNSEGQTVRFVKPSTYNSMVYNTCLTRNGWVQTLNDGKDMGIGYYFIRSHAFSCSHCLDHQERAMSREECLDLLGVADERVGDILHPNCKCELSFFNEKTQTKPIDRQKADEQYHIREQVMSLLLKKEGLLTDAKIYKMQGSVADYDKTLSKIEKVNSSIKELQNQLLTAELRKQVVAKSVLPL